MNLFQYLFHRATWQRLPVMPRQYSADYEPTRVDRDTQLLMALAHVRSPHSVEHVRRKHGAKDTHQLVRQLPWRKRPRYVKARAMALARRALGLSGYDPLRAHVRRGRR